LFFVIANVLQNNVLAKQEFSANDRSFNPDGNGNPAVAIFALRKSQQQIGMDSRKMVC
jgi:hypothetical protein